MDADACLTKGTDARYIITSQRWSVLIPPNVDPAAARGQERLGQLLLSTVLGHTPLVQVPIGR